MKDVLSNAIERRINRVIQRPPYAVQMETAALHRALFIVDMHADTLLWNRDLLEGHSVGHVDLPRLEAGNVALQVFGVVTQSPKGQNFEANTADSDQLTTLMVAQRWPRRTWSSRFQRALYQAEKLRRFEARSGGRLVRVLTAGDLSGLLARRAAGERVVGGFASLEGVHALEGSLENLDRLFAAGVRMVGLTHFFDNEAAGSAHGVAQGGLTDFGRAVVRRAQELGMTLDLAHASPRAVDEVLHLADGPVVVSHGGVRGAYDSPRNLSDEQLKRLAAGGGVIGMALFEGALAKARVDLAVEAMRYAADRVGVEHVGFGSDFDGAVAAPIDASGLPLLTEAMLSAGFSAEEIGKILGGNAARVLARTLPQP